MFARMNGPFSEHLHLFGCLRLVEMRVKMEFFDSGGQSRNEGGKFSGTDHKALKKLPRA